VEERARSGQRDSLEDHSRSPAGNNFSLSISGLIRLGKPLDIHPNKADEISGRSNKWVEFTDGDGTTHRFDGTTGPDGVTRWQEPPGVNLYLRSLPDGDSNGKWALTRPDKVTFYFDADGFPLSVQDRNDNRIRFTLQDTPSGEDPGGPKKRITAVTDAGGRSFLIDYLVEGRGEEGPCPRQHPDHHRPLPWCARAKKSRALVYTSRTLKDTGRGGSSGLPRRVDRVTPSRPICFGSKSSISPTDGRRRTGHSPT